MQNVITLLFNGLNPSEQTALQATHDTLAPEWDAGDDTTRPALELQFTEALNAFRLTE
jgi:hypothetical protein